MALDSIQKYFQIVGRLLLGLLAAIVAIIALLRFGFAFGQTWLFDVQKYLFALLVPVSMVVAYSGDKHVRAGFSGRAASSLTRVLEHLVLVAVPMALLAIFTLPLVVLSWSQWETSGEFGGLPGYFAVKSMLVVCFVAVTILAAFKLVRICKAN